MSELLLLLTMQIVGTRQRCIFTSSFSLHYLQVLLLLLLLQFSFLIAYVFHSWWRPPSAKAAHEIIHPPSSSSLATQVMLSRRGAAMQCSDDEDDDAGSSLNIHLNGSFLLSNSRPVPIVRRVRWTDTDRTTAFASNATLLCISSVVLVALHSGRSIGQTGAHHCSDWETIYEYVRRTRGAGGDGNRSVV